MKGTAEAVDVDSYTLTLNLQGALPLTLDTVS